MTKDTSGLTFVEDGHIYRWNGNLVPSVTQLLRPLYEDELAAIPPAALERARARGHKVHWMTEAIDEGMARPGDYALEDEAPYVDAWLAFKEDQELLSGFTSVELRFCNQMLMYAGCVDRLILTPTGRRLIDIKTGPATRVTGVQLAGYALGLNDVFRFQDQSMGTPIDARNWIRQAVHLTKKGTYTVETYSDSDDFTAFMALRNLHFWRMKK